MYSKYHILKAMSPISFLYKLNSINTKGFSLIYSLIIYKIYTNKRSLSSAILVKVSRDN